MTIPVLPDFIESSPLSESFRTRLLTRLFNTVVIPIAVSIMNPVIRHISDGMNCPMKSERSIERPKTSALIKLIMNAETTGIFMSLLLYAAAARNVSMLTITASNIS